MIGSRYPRVLISAVTTSKNSNHKCGIRRASEKWEEAARDRRIFVGMKAESVIGKRASGKRLGRVEGCGSGLTTTTYDLYLATPAINSRSKAKSTLSSSGPTTGNQNRMTPVVKPHPGAKPVQSNSIPCTCGIQIGLTIQLQLPKTLRTCVSSRFVWRKGNESSHG